MQKTKIDIVKYNKACHNIQTKWIPFAHEYSQMSWNNKSKYNKYINTIVIPVTNQNGSPIYYLTFVLLPETLSHFISALLKIENFSGNNTVKDLLHMSKDDLNKWYSHQSKKLYADKLQYLVLKTDQKHIQAKEWQEKDVKHFFKIK